ncbi:hypothetical protein AA0242T_2241 [Acetobacter aceti NRIC 0242]|uniref:Uncharacterized protein n=1 Tax=Acetobacter aceti NBRC 14818 TaxID=887700 RepID=A0AB33IHL2_ACEAC|nr:hypothetical protein EMQ_2186 [Acetobacter aceti NBRC 14818]GAN58585.1 hypothetical protein Abac_058_048 [Acetobacter aceti NBRC 14818]GBO81539.1 hypothetical protein AA0242T_2241 [Acetobacter aceti NRIC 0242]
MKKASGNVAFLKKATPKNFLLFQGGYPTGISALSISGVQIDGFCIHIGFKPVLTIFAAETAFAIAVVTPVSRVGA